MKKSRAVGRILTAVFVLCVLGLIYLAMNMDFGDRETSAAIPAESETAGEGSGKPEESAPGWSAKLAGLLGMNSKDKDSAQKEKIIWPAIELNGVMVGTTDTPGSAILNGQFVQLNHKHQGVAVLEVKNEGVLLEFDGEQLFLRIGERVTPRVHP
jgi:hypothetical protein